MIVMKIVDVFAKMAQILLINKGNHADDITIFKKVYSVIMEKR
jgi:hypothetical protein